MFPVMKSDPHQRTTRSLVLARSTATLMTLALACWGWWLPESRVIAAPSNHSEKYHLLVRWKEAPTSAAAAAGNARIGSSVVRDLSALGWQQVALPARMSVREGSTAYAKLEAVTAVEPDYPLAINPPVSALPAPAPRAIGLQSATPNDPRYSAQWYLAKIGAPGAWAVTTGSTNIVVAILDTGVGYTHPDLEPNMWRNPGETGLDASGRDKATNG